jgi:hypothetical protein
MKVNKMSTFPLSKSLFLLFSILIINFTSKGKSVDHYLYERNFGRKILIPQLVDLFNVNLVHIKNLNWNNARDKNSRLF